MIEPPDWLEVVAEIWPRIPFRLPELIFGLIGLAFALRLWRADRRADRRAAVLVLVGSLLVFLSPLCHESGRVLIMKRPELFGLEARRRGDIGAGWLWLQLGCSFLTAGGGLCLLLALFAWRHAKPSVSWEVEPEEMTL